MIKCFYLFLISFFLINSNLVGQNIISYIESDTAFQSFRGNYSNISYNFYLQFYNDSLINGYVNNARSTVIRELKGVRHRDSIILFELGNNTDNKVLSYKGVYFDSLNLKWLKLNTEQEKGIVLNLTNTTGNIITSSKNNNKLIFQLDSTKYKVPLVSLFDKPSNYVYNVLMSEKIGDKVYVLVRYHNFLEPPRQIESWLRLKDHYLMYARFNEAGGIDTIQVIRIKSEPDSIQLDPIKGRITNNFDEELEFDIIYINKNFKYNVKLNRSEISKGLIIKKLKSDIPWMISKSFKLNLDTSYNFNLQYNYYLALFGFLLYQLDILYEIDGKNIDKFSKFIKELKSKELYTYKRKIRPLLFDNIKVDDYNFDGIKDFNAIEHETIIMDTIVSNVWIYNKKLNLYERNEFLSDLPNIKVDYKNKLIRSSFHKSKKEFELVDYQFKNNKYLKLNSIISTYDPLSKTQTIKKGGYINDVWKVETKTITK